MSEWHPSLRHVEVELLDAERAHNAVEDAELQGRQGSDHDAPCPEALRAKLANTCLLGDVHHALRDGAVATRTSLVDLGEQRVRGMRDDGGHTAWASCPCCCRWLLRR